MKKYKLNKDLVTHKVNDKLAIFSAEQSSLLTLNHSATIIFQGLKLNWSEDQIVKKLVDTFDISNKIAKQDLDRFKKELIDKRVLIYQK